MNGKSPTIIAEVGVLETRLLFLDQVLKCIHKRTNVVSAYCPSVVVPCILSRKEDPTTPATWILAEEIGISTMLCNLLWNPGGWTLWHAVALSFIGEAATIERYRRGVTYPLGPSKMTLQLELGNSLGVVSLNGIPLARRYPFICSYERYGTAHHKHFIRCPRLPSYLV